MKKFIFLINPKRLLLPAIILFLLLHTQTIKAQFAYGADVSWLSQMEHNNYIFKDNSGNQKDCLDILKSKGINALRFRIWVNPGGNFNNKKDVAYMCGRAKSKGFDVMIDFHMSDTWADPSKQGKPAAWVNDSFLKLQTDLYNHVYSVLDTLRSIGVTPKWVQIGNETTDGMLWEDGRASTHMSNFAALINSGYKAVKAIDTTIKVIVHLSDGGGNSTYRWMFDNLKSYGVKWDIIGMSVYPTYTSYTWAVEDSYVQINMADMITRYNTKVMVCEVGYPANQPTDANNFLTDIIAKTTKSAGGLGVFYWEPECYNWQSYGLGAWDYNTQEPTAAMDAFLAANPVSIEENKIITDYDFKIYPNPFNPSTNIDYKVPEASNISIIIYDVTGREVTRLVDDYKYEGSYSVRWNANNIPSGMYFCRMITQKYASTKKIVLIK